jgi:hypothetical protein
MTLKATSIGQTKNQSTTKISNSKATSKNQANSESSSKSADMSNAKVSESNAPETNVMSSHEANTELALSRFQLALKTGYLGKNFMEGLAAPGANASQSKNSGAGGAAEVQANSLFQGLDIEGLFKDLFGGANKKPENRNNE